MAIDLLALGAAIGISGGGGSDPRVTQILKLIPTQATEENKLADKDFVNSTATSQASHYIYKTNAQGLKVPFDSLAELQAYSGTVTPNDYANVISTDSAGNTYYDRYTAVETESGMSWSLAFRINNSSLTAVQWAALNSGITDALVALISSAVQEVQINGVKISETGVANIPLATDSDYGLIKGSSSGGVRFASNNTPVIVKATDSEITAKTNLYHPVVPANLQLAVDTGVKGSVNYISYTCEMSDDTTKTLKLYSELI